ncbi:barstar family protein [Chitinophaga cymbidii]|uniref:Barstar (barnase inhibitor) domain-containing protein n=1 Tax=Chitinophaga cymbidii TaxID=1096750 RepID=A0A512RK98_9BACT|nr:barstar family protein [Chitinophaga cymbidii]GEP96124.1 hypothetical protein CCY01nite_23840 [Chitinophaga cymbidii]
MRTIIIDGNRFSDLEGFYSEIDRVLTKGLDWRTGHNLDAFNDLLRGGFGVHEYEEPIRLVWENSEKSREELGEVYGVLVGIIADHEHISFEGSGFE